jgi:formamidopyrimidine-DNA glycosylase
LPGSREAACGVPLAPCAMPELPDVEVGRQYLEATALCQEIEHVYVQADIVREISPATLRRRLTGRSLSEARRHGKVLFARAVGNGWLRMHFGMTGMLAHYRDEADAPSHVRLALHFTNGSRLGFHLPRKLGYIAWADDPSAWVLDEGLGPDALADDLSGDRFIELLGGRRAPVKAALMNQKVVAGVGNIYADEALFQAETDPRSGCADLPEPRLRAVYRSTRRVLRRAIEARARPADLPDHYLLPHRREDGVCPRCGEAWTRVKISGRTTYLCEIDQERF